MEIEANGIHIYCEQEGSGPDLLLIPGLGASTHTFYAQLKGLSPVCRVTVMDPRGHGRSGKPHGPYSIGQMAADAADAIRALGIGPAVVGGSSMASLIACELAAAEPDLVRALILIGGFATLAPAGKERFEARAQTAESQGMGPIADAVAGAALGAATHSKQPALVGLFRQGLLLNEPMAYAACCRAIAACDVTPILADIRCPTLILFGSQEMVAPLSAARVLKTGIPHAEVVVIPDAGHIPFLEQPAAFNAAVQAFLTGLA